MNDSHNTPNPNNTRDPNNTGQHHSHGAGLDAQVQVMKTHNQSDAAEVRDAKTRAQSVLNRAIAEETRRPSPVRKKPFMWVGGVAAAAAAVTVVAINLPRGTEVELKPATPPATSTTTTAAPTTTSSTATAAPTTPAETATATPTAAAEKLKPAQTAPTTATTATTTADGLVDPFALASVEQEVVFTYVRDLVDGRKCNADSDNFATLKALRNTQLTPDEVRATRSQTRLTALGDITKKELQQISTAISALKDGTFYDPSGTYLGEAEHWGVGCDGTGYTKLFGGSKDQAAATPPMPSGRANTLRPFVEAVQADPKVKAATKTFNQCYGKATQQDLGSEGIGMYSFVKYSQDGSTPPKMRDVEQIWKCYEASGLQAASRQAQAQWQKGNPAIVTKWKKDPAFYASKVKAAQKIIATEETKVGK